MEETHKEAVDGFTLIVAFFRGAYQGRAWPNRKGLTKQSVVGESIEDVLTKLKGAARTEFAKVAAELRSTLPARHAAYLGFPPGHVTVRSVIKSARASHCYHCQFPVDNTKDFECVICNGWIICNECLSCGCGYSKRY